MKLKVILIFLLTISIYKSINASSLSSIPKERIDIDGTYNENGLAKRTARSIEKDLVLIALNYKNDVYVMQSGSQIILKGIVPDQHTLERVVNIASGIKGVTKVDAEQIKIQSFTQ